MKKIFFSALAALCLSACVQEAMVETPQGDAIAFENAFIDNATRAAVDPSFNINTLNAFKVWAYVNEPNGVVFKGKEVSRTGAGAPWTYDGTQYWAPGKPYYFEAIAPAEGNWELATNDADPTVLSFTNANGIEDLLYASTQQTGAAIGTVNESVKFSFGHLLSKVKFTFNNGFLTDNVTVKVTDIKMVAPKKADIDLSKEADMAWTNASESVTLAFGNVADLNLEVKSNECADERFTIPGDYEYKIEFNLELYMGAQPVYNEPKTSTVSGVKLEMGKAYNFVAEISPATLDFEAIEFEVVEVEEWITSGAPSYDNQAAEAELQAAAQLGGTVTLTKDVAITTPIVVTSDFVLNLNGHNITAAAWAEEGSTELTESYGFWVKNGGNLTINGEGEIRTAPCEYSMAIWANGGKVTVNGGSYYNAGEGSDLVYASGAGSVVEIYGGYFEACERNHNNGTLEQYSALNLKGNGANGERITVYGGSFYKFNPADNLSENPKQSFVAEGYFVRQDGDNYNVIAGALVTTKAELLNVAENTSINPIYFGGDIEMGATALVLSRDLVLNMEGKKYHVYGDANNFRYGFIIDGEKNLTINNANIEGDGCYVVSGANVVYNGGTYCLHASTTSRYVFYAGSNDKLTTVTINGGDFSIHKDRKKCGYLCAAANSIIYIKGGNFAAPWPEGSSFKTANGGQVIITGGTFGFDPSAWVAPGYKAVKNGSTWTVTVE